jgi:hypothetical protein
MDGGGGEARGQSWRGRMKGAGVGRVEAEGAESEGEESEGAETVG